METSALACAAFAPPAIHGGGDDCGGAGSARRFWLFDTFEGMPAPTAQDDARSKRIWRRVHEGTQTSAPGTVRDGKWAYSPLDEAKATMARTGYPRAQLRFVQGKVEDTLRDARGSLPEQIALLRMDST